MPRCPKGMTKDADGNCVEKQGKTRKNCPKGQRRNSAGECVDKTSTRKRCPKGMIKNTDGECVERSQMTKSPRKKCPKGMIKNEEGECVQRTASIKTRKNCPKGQRRNANGDCVSKEEYKLQRMKKEASEEWDSEVDKEFDEILNDLRQGKLKKMNFNNQNAPALDCNVCLKKFTITELENELNSRKKAEQHINILIPRKKVPK